MLAVEIVSLTPDTWGWTSSPGAPGSPVPARLGLARTDPAFLLWEIDAEAGTATANGKYTRSLAPFLGVTGVTPAAPGCHSTIPPRAEAGGNIDCKELVAGSVLYLPVNVDGGLLYLGDGHGAQGDGESCGTAIECGMTTEAVVSVAGERPLRCVHAETPAGLVTFGFSADLNEAMGDALDAMVTWMAELYGTSRAEALALASTCVDLRVTQVVNITWGVHALLPAGLLS
jgi:acetamidase/formamidase